MSSQRVDLTVLPIDVGFDLRLLDYVVEVAPDTKSAAYDVDGKERIVRGDLAAILAALHDAGYKTQVPGAS